MIDDTLPDGWFPLSLEQARVFLAQLALEIGSDHPVFTHCPQAIATFGGSDDVVYAVENWKAPFFVCHLAWPRPDTRPRIMRWLRPKPAPRLRPALKPLHDLNDLARYFD